jgi:hypothetical protein
MTFALHFKQSRYTHERDRCSTLFTVASILEQLTSKSELAKLSLTIYGCYVETSPALCEYWEPLLTVLNQRSSAMFFKLKEFRVILCGKGDLVAYEQSLRAALVRFDEGGIVSFEHWPEEEGS